MAIIPSAIAIILSQIAQIKLIPNAIVAYQQTPKMFLFSRLTQFMLKC